MKDIIRKLLAPLRRSKYGFFGDYPDWKAAESKSTGYDNPEILDKVESAMLMVKSGQIAYERDSVTFDAIQYSWPVLAALLWSASRNANTLSIVDFGGSLGSSYFQNRGMLSHLTKIEWSIVEQPKLVEVGKNKFEDDKLRFYRTISECPDSRVFLASSSIQYIADYKQILDEVLKRNFETIVFDRTPFWDGPDRITVQKVSPRIYDASYPSWVLNAGSFKRLFTDQGYELVAESDQGAMSYDGKAGLVKLKSFIFKK